MLFSSYIRCIIILLLNHFFYLFDYIIAIILTDFKYIASDLESHRTDTEARFAFFFKLHSKKKNDRILVMIYFFFALIVLFSISVFFLFRYRDRAYYERFSGQKNWWWLWDHFFLNTKKLSKPFCFAHFDIKDFKMINENFGHLVADKVLARVGQVAEKESWVKHLVRCHNDNFALVTELLSEEELKTKLMELFNKIDSLPEDPSYKIYYRCGAVSSEHSIAGKDTVPFFAKLAQVQGIKPNKTEIIIYTESMKDNYFHAKKIVQEIPRALKEKELIVYIQPKHHISGTLSGGEALIRWNRHFNEFLFPSSFIGYVEEAGLIHLIDFYVLETVCKKMQEWRTENRALVPISVNISRYTITIPFFLEKALQVVDSYDVPHELIEFELTETALYDNQEYIVSIMEAIKIEGFKLSMDDFGTGYSSLNLLQKMPLDTLKLDKSFVDNILTSIEADEIFKAQVILKNILSMTKDMNVDSLAEGVELEKQKNILERWGCTHIQGHYYNKAMPIYDFEEILRKI